MKSYLLKEYDLELVHFIKNNNPDRIWFCYIAYVFEYDGFYIQMDIYCAERFLFGIKKYEQYVMSVAFKKMEGIFEFKETSTLLSENESIKNLYITRTQLGYEEITDTESPYTHLEYLKNPDLITDQPEAGRLFLVDVGVTIQLENKMLHSYIINNDDDFMCNIEDDLFPTHEYILNKDKYYKFIKV
jgi:hypothetical protein